METNHSHHHSDGGQCGEKCHQEVKLMENLMSSVGAKALVVAYWMNDGQLAMEAGGDVPTPDALKRFIAGALFGLTDFAMKQGFGVEEMSAIHQKSKTGNKYFF